MEIWLEFILSVASLIIIFLIIRSVLNKNIKDLKISFGFFKGFEFSCSFFEKSNTKHHR